MTSGAKERSTESSTAAVSDEAKEEGERRMESEGEEMLTGGREEERRTV